MADTRCPMPDYVRSMSERERAEIPERFRWHLGDLYPSVEAWHEAREKIEAALPALRAFEGRLGESASVLADALETESDLRRQLSRVGVYASLLADEDTRASMPQGMRQQVIQLAASLGAEAAYLEPEILALPAGAVETYLSAEPRLAPFRFMLEDIRRRAAHTLPSGEERVLAETARIAGSASTIFTVFSNADFPYPTVRLSDETDVRLTPPAFAASRASANRDDRRLVMSAYFEALAGFGRTFGTTMNASTQKAWFFAKTRRYESSLAAALDGSNIPVQVYTRLVQGVNRHLPTFHRYLRLRARMLGVPELHYYDLYAPLVGSVTRTYTPEEAEQHVLASLAPLGSEYVAVVARAFNERWIDLYPTAGKRSGAYSPRGGL